MDTERFEIAVCRDAAELAAASADLVAASLRRALRQKKNATLLLSGGSTPLETYARLAVDDLDWDHIGLYWGDERCVAPGDPASNFGQARRVLIEPARIPARAVHRIRGELGPEAAAADYERRLRASFEGCQPSFDLALLGVGEDGHTASLFDGSIVEPEGRWVTATRAPQPPLERVSLTYEALRGAGRTVFLVRGGGKAAVLDQILSGAGGQLPAARVAAEASSVVWMVDRGALQNGVAPRGERR